MTMITSTGQDETANIRVVPSRQIAKHLLDIGAVIFNVDKPFTWTSGIKSPIYCDNRLINSAVNARDAVIREFTKIVSENFLDRTNIIAGVATGGMTYGVLIADRLSLPFIYIRSERKEHGRSD
jgi:orotate phosphoribosyltransferase